MTFARTRSGLSNYSKFFRRKIVFIEGAINKSNCLDQIYYEGILLAISKKDQYKIKPVGSKIDVVKHINSISHNIEDYIAIVDKDLIGVTSSIISSNNLYTTKYYSWENEFWNYEMVKGITDNMCLFSDDNSISILYKRTKKRAAYLSSLDNSLQINCKNILPKNGTSCGLSVSKNNAQVISSAEIKRLRTAFSNNRTGCSIEKLIIKESLSQNPKNVINGHFWEYLAINIIQKQIKKDMIAKSIPNDVIKQLAWSKFTRDPSTTLSKSVIAHYSQIFV